MAEPRYFRLCHPAAILLQIKYKKSEPLADRFQVRISRVWWSIGDSNSCSANFIVATAHWADRSLKFEKEFDEISATGGHRILSPSPATGGVLTRRSIPIRQMSKPGTITGMIPGFDVEHRRFELLTPTLPVLCATNCANAPNSEALFSFPSLLLCDKMTEKERGMNDLV